MKALLNKIADAVQAAVDASAGTDQAKEDAGMGADGTMAKGVDRLAEQAAVRVLDEEGSELNVVSEEAGLIERGGEEVLVLDPVDGTYNWLEGIPFYSVSMAVGCRLLSDVKYGLVRNLVDGSTYWAEKDRGATWNGEAIQVRPYVAKKGMFLMYMGMLASERSRGPLDHARRVRSLGSASLEMCMVARGQADMFHMACPPGAHTLRITDIAAATLIVREAGGKVYDDQLNRLDLELDVKARSNVVAVGDKRALGVLT